MRPAFLFALALVTPAAFSQTHAMTVSTDKGISPSIHAAAAANPGTAVSLPHNVLHQHVSIVVDKDFANPMMNTTGGDLSITFGAPNSQTAPRLQTLTGLSLTPAQVAAVPQKSEVDVRVLIDEAGLAEALRLRLQLARRLMKPLCAWCVTFASSLQRSRASVSARTPR
ncbi:hypothetical protein ACFQBQ_05860 [Granulicella cerasi]|uniref:Uncharacterized protein n=1 Tax=Granulicella cerasi TaxID=741063 RepID=A0ABW1Z9M0_9BACT